MTKDEFVKDQRVRWVGAVCGIGLVFLVGRGCTPPSKPAGAAAVVPTMPASAAPTTEAPRIDPLSGLGGPLNPTAAALIGPDYSSRLEAARRVNELQARQPGLTTCGIFVGAALDQTWELSAVQGPAHPVPLLAACPWLPTSTKGP